MLISIVIPVYNSEQYLEQCLDSIINQTFADFEVLLINDGSTDKSGAICDKYAQNDNRIKVFHQENGGVSSARNWGIKNVRGEWITFVDSDDWIEEDYFAPIQKYLFSDLILLSINRFDGNKITQHLSFENRNYDKMSFLDELPLYPNFPGPWGKFFKSSIIKKNCIAFDTDISFGEDALFNLKYLKYCTTISTASMGKYYYRATPNGLSKKEFFYDDDLYLYNQLKNALLDNFHQEDIEANKKIVLKNLVYPTSRLLSSIYRDDNLNTYKLLAEFVSNNKEYILFLYRKSKGWGLLNSILIRCNLIFLADVVYKRIVFKK